MIPSGSLRRSQRETWASSGDVEAQRVLLDDVGHVLDPADAAVEALEDRAASGGDGRRPAPRRAAPRSPR